MNIKKTDILDLIVKYINDKIDISKFVNEIISLFNEKCKKCNRSTFSLPITVIEKGGYIKEISKKIQFGNFEEWSIDIFYNNKIYTFSGRSYYNAEVAALEWLNTLKSNK